jgi:hypothetical protein
MKEVLGSSETSVLTRATWHNIPEDTILLMFLWYMKKSRINVADIYLKKKY